MNSYEVQGHHRMSIKWQSKLVAAKPGQSPEHPHVFCGASRSADVDAFADQAPFHFLNSLTLPGRQKGFLSSWSSCSHVVVLQNYCPVVNYL